MAVLPDNDRNLIHGLADFWVSFFKDTSFTEAFYRAGQVQLGQIYLEICQAVLGTSLNHLPLFSKYYYRLLLVREDQVAFEEGPTTADDRYAYVSDDPIAQAPTLLNRVVAPTRVLEALRDYDVAEGAIKFRVDPFDVDGNGASLVNVPVRTVQVAAEAACANPRAAAWGALGVRAGDTLRFRYPLAGTPREAVIRAVDGSRLMLAEDHPEFETALTGKTFRLDVVRTPFDAVKSAVPVPSPATAYEAVSLSTNVGTSTATLSVAPSAFAPAVGQYLYLVDTDRTENSGYFRVTNVAGLVLTLATPATFGASAGPWSAYLVDHGPSTSATPRFPLPNDTIDPGSVVISGRRAVARVVDGVTYPAGGSLLEGVDYAIDYDVGTLQYLSVWDPLVVGRADYTWRLRVARETFTVRGAFAAATSYAAGDVVTSGGKTWVARVAFTSGGSFNQSDWVEYAHPFAADRVFDLRELALWAPDVLVDREALYTKYGYLLGYKRPSSEAYRAFLKGVAQLFLLGPSLERFESALNVMAGLPVIRDDGEVLRDYDAGYLDVSVLSDPTLGDGGRLIDTSYGRDGTLVNSTSTFSSPTARFFAGDVGAVLRVRTPAGFEEYAVTAVAANGLSATIAPPPPDTTDVEWSYSHNQLRRHFRVESTNVTHLFSDADVDGVVVIDSAFDARNVGAFRIVAVVSPTEVVLETPYDFADASGLSWRLSRTQQQVVTTSRARYALPLRVPLRDDVTDPASVDALTFSAFEALSTVVRVTDYRDDPTWWHRITIPEELLTLTAEAPGRRTVTPQLIPHLVNALDQAVINDFGIFVGKDDTGEPGIERAGAVTWLGGPWVRLDFAIGTNVPAARPSDVGQYVRVDTAPFRGYYQIKEIGPGNTSVRLDRFPPREAASRVPPQTLADAELPPLLYRRTVAFVLMDRFLKYHAMRVQLNTNGGITSDFITEATRLVREAKPAHVFAYIEPATSFVDTMAFSEDFLLAWGPEYVDHIKLVNNDFTGATEMGADEYHRISSGSHAGVSPGGAVAFTVTPTFPYVPDRHRFLFGRFLTGTSGGKRLVEGQHYTFNYTTGAVSVTSLDAGAYDFRYVVVALRAHAYAVNWWSTGAQDGETPSAVHGADALVRTHPGVGPGDYGFVDRPIEIEIQF